VVTTTPTETPVSLAEVYCKAIKYALLPNEHVDDFVNAHHAGDSAAEMGLADHLVEQDDPRGDVMHRSMGLTKHPEQEMYANGVGYGITDPVTGDERDPGHVVRQGDGGSATALHFQPVSHTPTPPPVYRPKPGAVGGYSKFTFKTPATAVHVRLGHRDHSTWADDGAGGLVEQSRRGTHYSGLFTPEEARGLADKLPPEHAAGVHEVLDKHFGPRQG
jgi:hypothetical protein